MQAEARVTTERASHYIKTLCNHFAHKAETSFTDERGDVKFQFGTSEMLAEGDALVLRVQAEDAERLAIAKDVVGGHLERFAYRGETLKVEWTDL